ncbi:MAG: cupin domain-containing protein [Bacteroidales bacterium]|nr:cupin domain-containing protein [Bacteroidales bacterium]
MKIGFDVIEESIIPNFKGGEKSYAAKMFFDGTNRIMKGRLIPGASIGLHTHEDSSEFMFFTAGKGYVIYDGERIELKAGDTHYCPKGHNHTLINDGDEDLCFDAVVAAQ